MANDYRSDRGIMVTSNNLDGAPNRKVSRGARLSKLAGRPLSGVPQTTMDFLQRVKKRMQIRG